MAGLHQLFIHSVITKVQLSPLSVLESISLGPTPACHGLPVSVMIIIFYYMAVIVSAL